MHKYGGVTLAAMNTANYYKKLWANAQSALTMIQAELDTAESDAMFRLDTAEIIRRTYKNQMKIGDKHYE